MDLHPLIIAGGIIVAVVIVGYVIYYLRERSTLRGYEEIAREVESLVKVLQAEIFRDGADLVLSGHYGKLPAIVRFSYADNTPGLNIQMKAPANFSLTVMPKTATVVEGRVLVRTSDEMFDARFSTRTDNPTQAKMFLAGKQVMGQLQKLCCSSKTFLTVSTGNLELSELVIPEPYTSRHISDHLASMASLASSLGAMPGADAVKVVGYKKEQSYVVHVAVAVLAITGLVVVASALRDQESQQNPQAASVVQANQPPSGISFAEAQRIAAVNDWRMTAAEDFDPSAVSWLGPQHDGDISGRISLALAGDDRSASAFILARRASQAAGRRVVLLFNNAAIFDGVYPSVAVAARVPKSNFDSITWQGKHPSIAPPDGDGLLVVRSASELNSGVILYLSGGSIASAAPLNYQTVRVE